MKLMKVGNKTMNLKTKGLFIAVSFAMGTSLVGGLQADIELDPGTGEGVGNHQY